MLRTIRILSAALLLAIGGLGPLGCAPGPAKQPAGLVKCATCGVDFASPQVEGEHFRQHPDHRGPLLKCSTCGLEFASPDAAGEHRKAQPAHKIEGALVKCSTCGVEITDPAGMKQHKQQTGH